MTDLPTAKTRPASNWSAIWVLPLIALLIGGWLAWRAYSETGIEIHVRFESGEGIQANKTEVVYKGMSVGKVKALTLDDEGSAKGVIATLLSEGRYRLERPRLNPADLVPKMFNYFRVFFVRTDV